MATIDSNARLKDSNSGVLKDGQNGHSTHQERSRIVAVLRAGRNSRQMKAEGNRNVTLGSFIVDPASRSLKPWGMGRVGISPLSSWRVPITRNETRSHRSNLIAPIARHREVPKRDAWVWAGFASPKHWRSRALP